MDYSRYAPQYDRMCDLLPVYQENIDLLLSHLHSFKLPEYARICDLGAGTGNFICAVADVLPNAQFTHLDLDPVMNERALEKYNRNGITVDIVQEYMQRATFEPESFDLVICVNSLNTAPPQLPMLNKISRWLKHNSHLFLIDFGRKQNVLDWGWYLFRSTIAQHGLKHYLRAIYENREALVQNRKGRADQNAGLTWIHTTKQLMEMVGAANLEVVHSQTCYRDYCDLVVARKPI